MASACHRGLSDSTELAWQEVGADQLGQLCKGGLQHWLKVDLKQLSGRCSTRKQAQKSSSAWEPDTSQRAKAKPGSECSKFVRKGSLVQVTFIHRHSLRFQLDMEKAG